MEIALQWATKQLQRDIKWLQTQDKLWQRDANLHNKEMLKQPGDAKQPQSDSRRLQTDKNRGDKELESDNWKMLTDFRDAAF